MKLFTVEMFKDSCGWASIIAVGKSEADVIEWAKKVFGSHLEYDVWEYEKQTAGGRLWAQMSGNLVATPEK